MDLQPVLARLEDAREEMLDDLRLLVEHESPTGDVARLDALADLLAARWEVLGASVRRHRVAGVGTHLEIRWDGFGASGGTDTAGGGTGAQGESGASTPPALVLCHMDTVHAVGMLARNPLRLTEGLVHGPGTQDMKAGIVMSWHAVRVLQRLGIPPARPVTVVITADEETGSATSRELIERLAGQSAYALVLEPAGGGGAVKTERKGVGQYRLEVTGVAAHAGMDFDRGVSANVELARLVLALHGLVDTAAGTTVNVGLMSGGTGGNTVPEIATAEVDVRFLDDAEAARVDQAVRALSVGPGASVAVTGGLNRPAMRRTADSAELYEHARRLAATIGVDLGEVAVGGASDGNFTAAAGVPTLDGLGAVGEGLHTPQEYAVVDSLPVRAALLAGLLATR